MPVFLWWLGASLLLASIGSGLTQAATANSSTNTSSTLTGGTNSAAIPLAEVPLEAESALANLQPVRSNMGTDQTTVAVQEQLPVMTREISAQLEENSRILAWHPSLEKLRHLEREWKELREELTDWSRSLSRRAAQLEQDVTRLDQLNQRWDQTRLAAEKGKVPQELLRRIGEVQAQIRQTRDQVQDQQALVLLLASQVTEQDGHVAEAISLIEHARLELIHGLLVKDSPAIWSPDVWPHTPMALLAESRRAVGRQFTALMAYGQRKPGRFIFHGLILVGTIVLLRWIRHRLHLAGAEGVSFRETVQVFEVPLATGVILSLLMAGWIYPQAPPLLWAAFGAAAVIPATVVLRKLMDPHLFPVLNALIVFYFVDQLRAVAASQEFLSRALFLVETIGGALFVVWLLRSEQLCAVPRERRNRAWRALALGARAALIGLTVAMLANSFGYERLAKFVANAVFGGAYLALVLYALLRILDGLIFGALRIYPLAQLGLVRHHRPLLQRRVGRALEWVAVVLWVLGLLESLSLRTPLWHGLNLALAATVSIGSYHISVGDVLLFGLTIWIALLTSRLVRFVLQEEVYPRVELAPGLYYSISTMLHYAILLAGFFIGVAILGFNLTKFTVLAGAVGVGLGFGLQNIINNFVSGIILLFERPIKIGDVIQLENTEGVVQRIGIRASVVRSVNGSEIIVPNGKLISDPLTNWTFSNRQRLLEIPLAIAPGPDPEDIIDLLRATVSDHPMVAKDPSPQALFLGVSGGNLNFQVRAWTSRFDDWQQIRSDLSLAISSALSSQKITVR